MKTTIETYRGIEIWFDTEQESFQCDIDDERSVKKSYPAIKKFIDEWRKDNTDFKPFRVEKKPWGSYGGKTGRIIGIRKDGAFTIELPNGKKEQVSKYDLDDFILFKPENKEKWELINELEKGYQDFLSQYREKKQEILSQFSITTLKDYQKQQL